MFRYEDLLHHSFFLFPRLYVFDLTISHYSFTFKCSILLYCFPYSISLSLSFFLFFTLDLSLFLSFSSLLLSSCLNSVFLSYFYFFLHFFCPFPFSFSLTPFFLFLPISIFLFPLPEQVWGQETLRLSKSADKAIHPATLINSHNLIVVVVVVVSKEGVRERERERDRVRDRERDRERERERERKKMKWSFFSERKTKTFEFESKNETPQKIDELPTKYSKVTTNHGLDQIFFLLSLQQQETKGAFTHAFSELHCVFEFLKLILANQGK